MNVYLTSPFLSLSFFLLARIWVCGTSGINDGVCVRWFVFDRSVVCAVRPIISVCVGHRSPGAASVREPLPVRACLRPSLTAMPPHRCCSTSRTLIKRTLLLLLLLHLSAKRHVPLIRIKGIDFFIDHTVNEREH